MPASSAECMSVTTGTANLSRTSASISNARMSPIPVKELRDERLAFLYEALNMHGIPSERDTAVTSSATVITHSRLSTTHGPAIRKKLPESVSEIIGMEDIISCFVIVLCIWSSFTKAVTPRRKNTICIYHSNTPPARGPFRVRAHCRRGCRSASTRSSRAYTPVGRSAPDSHAHTCTTPRNPNLSSRQ